MLSVDIHIPKIFGFAILDIVGVIIISYVLAKLTFPSRKQLITRWIQVSVISFIIGVYVHYYMGIPTMVGYYLCINDYESVMNYRNNSNYGILPVGDNITTRTHNGTYPSYCGIFG